MTDQQSSQSLAEKCIRIRLASRGMSQSWLAEAAGMSPFYLSRRMTRGQKFSTDDLDRIAEVFGTDLGGLLDPVRAVA